MARIVVLKPALSIHDINESNFNLSGLLKLLEVLRANQNADKHFRRLARDLQKKISGRRWERIFSDALRRFGGRRSNERGTFVEVLRFFDCLEYWRCSKNFERKVAQIVRGRRSDEVRALAASIYGEQTRDHILLHNIVEEWESLRIKLAAGKKLIQMHDECPEVYFQILYSIAVAYGKDGTSLLCRCFGSTTFFDSLASVLRRSTDFQVLLVAVMLIISGLETDKHNLKPIASKLDKQHRVKALAPCYSALSLLYRRLQLVEEADNRIYQLKLRVGLLLELGDPTTLTGVNLR